MFQKQEFHDISFLHCVSQYLPFLSLWIFCLSLSNFFSNVAPGLSWIPIPVKHFIIVILPLVFRGCLFYGPPGTGKTLVARALANECSQGERKVSFFMRKGADCLSKWVGESERQLRLLFDQVNWTLHPWVKPFSFTLLPVWLLPIVNKKMRSIDYQRTCIVKANSLYFDTLTFIFKWSWYLYIIRYQI